jgi:hypothetical protein
MTKLSVNGPSFDNLRHTLAALWPVYTCGLAYLIGTALSGFPLASAIIAGVVTTIAIGVVFLYLRRVRTQKRKEFATPAVE